MQNQNQYEDLISIIIPAYNAAPYIEETIRSIQDQTYRTWEIIVINDGSTDNTVDLIRSFKDSRIQTITQKNAGVAAARNKGLFFAKGEFVVFFDADDLMTPEFLIERLLALKSDPGIGYVGGLIETFPIQANPKKAAASDPVNEILFFNASFATVPSNYMFRKKILSDNNIRFNRELSSSADRFFIWKLQGLPGEKTFREKRASCCIVSPVKACRTMLRPA